MTAITSRNDIDVQAFRPPAQRDRVHRPHRHRQDDEEIASVQAKREQRREASVGEDGEHAAERHADARDLQRREALVQEHPRHQDDHHGDERVEDDAVGRRRVVEAEVRKAVVRAHADRPEKQQQAPARADARPVAHDVAPREGREDQDREEPAEESHGHGRNLLVEPAPDDPVAGPEERCERQQEIGRCAALGHGAASIAPATQCFRAKGRSRARNAPSGGSERRHCCCRERGGRH